MTPQEDLDNLIRRPMSLPVDIISHLSYQLLNSAALHGSRACRALMSGRGNIPKPLVRAAVRVEARLISLEGRLFAWLYPDCDTSFTENVVRYLRTWQ